MSAYTPEQFARLPKWAQREIEQLNGNVDHWKAKAQIGPEGSNTFVDSGLNDEKPLGHGPRIRFQLGDRWDEKVEAHIEGDFLTIHGGHALEIQPVSSNVARVRLGDWWN
jgi:hypothetical protein